MSYLLDANVFIQAKNLHYGLDFCPAFWDWLVQKGNTGAVLSIDKVADEIKDGQDELTTWAKDYGYGLFKSNSVNRIKIPNVCVGLGIHCTTPYQMLRNEQARFVLGVQP